MAKKTPKHQKQFVKWILFAILIISLPLTLWSLQLQTQTKSDAAYESNCAKQSSWSNILDHTDYATSVRYHFKFANNCPDTHLFKFSATNLNPDWTYNYEIPGAVNNCTVNTVCEMWIKPNSKRDIWVTIKRPKSENAGIYYIKLRARNPYISELNSFQTISYRVIPL